MAQTSQEILQGVSNETIETARVTLEQAIEVTQDPWFFVPFIILSFLMVLFYIIWGALTSARGPDNRKIPDTIQTWNFWMIFGFLVIFICSFLLLIIFPFWLKFVG